MATKTTPKALPLDATHRALGAPMVEFAGWNMPVQYSGIKEEHMAVRERAGLFDVSHMGQVFLRGETALDSMQKLFTNDVSRLKIGGAQYTFMATHEGTCIDDLIVYCTGLDDHVLIVNASRREEDLQWIQKNVLPKTQVDDRSDSFILLALQGPRSVPILQQLTKYDLGNIKPFNARRIDIAGVSVLVATTGYTGERGFELMGAAQHAQKLWDALMCVGAPLGMLPCGLGARDSLRIEAGLPLYGHELSQERALWSAMHLRKFIRLQKNDFIGKDAISTQSMNASQEILIGFELMERSARAQDGFAIHAHDGSLAGVVTSGVRAYALQKNIGMGYVCKRCAPQNALLQVQIRNKRVTARAVKLPFYSRKGGAAK